MHLSRPQFTLGKYYSIEMIPRCWWNWSKIAERWEYFTTGRPSLISVPLLPSVNFLALRTKLCFVEGKLLGNLFLRRNWEMALSRCFNLHYNMKPFGKTLENAIAAGYVDGKILMLLCLHLYILCSVTSIFWKLQQDYTQLCNLSARDFIIFIFQIYMK